MSLPTRALILAALLLSPAPASAQPDPALAVALAALDDPQVTGELPATPVRIGRADLRPEPGARMFVLSAGGRPCGLLLEGRATLAYHVTDPLSRELARRNGGRAGGVTVHDSPDEVTLTTTVRGAAVWGWDLHDGAAPSSPGAIPVPEWVKESLARKTTSNPGRDMLLADWNGHAGYRWGLFRGSADILGLEVDPRPSARVESLSMYESVPRGGPYAGRLTQAPLVDQPIGRAWSEVPAPDLASTETSVVVRNDVGTHVSIVTRTRLAPLHGGQRLLHVSLQSESVSDDGERHPLNVMKLRVDGSDAQFSHAWGSLLVGLPRAYAKVDTLLLEVETEGDFLTPPAGNSYWVLGTSSWYPRPSSTGVEWADITVTVTAPPPFVPFAGGEPSATRSDRADTVVAALAGPMEFAVAGAGKHQRLVDDRDGARVVVATYGGVKRDEAMRLAGIVHGVRGCLEQLLGVPYPFRTLQLLEMDDWGWGQAPPGIIFITKEALLSQAGIALVPFAEREAAAATSRSANERIAHEVAHGWFPHVAKIPWGEESWLSESFAEYLSSVCLERAAADQARGRIMFRRQVSRWRDRAALIGDHASIYLAEHLGWKESDRRARFGLLYGRGPLVLHAVRAELARTAGGEKEGDRLFYTWIRSYVKNFVSKRGGTPYLVAVLNQVTSKDWGPWFDRYVFGTETPVE